MPRPLRLTLAAAVTVALLGAGAACSDNGQPQPKATRGPSDALSEAASGASAPTSPAPSSPAPSSPAPSSPASETPTSSPRPGTTPPAWLGTRELPTGPDGYAAAQTTPPELRRRAFNLPDPVPMLPGRGYASRVVAPAPARVLARSTWRPGCPVAREELAWLRVTFRGFDGARHTGELLVDRDDADDLVQVFGDLWRADFPMERMVITTRADQDATPTGDGNDTSAFVCRPITGGTSYSEHASGRAVDVNPFQNPYVRGDLVLPELATAYARRTPVRPGMITADGPVVAAFARIGWGWGGAWTSLKDYQHFSATGR